MGRSVLGIAIWSKNFPTNGMFHCPCTTQVLFAGHAKFPALPGHLDHHVSQYLSLLGQQIKAVVFSFTARQRIARGLPLPVTWTHVRRGFFLLWAGRIDRQDWVNSGSLLWATVFNGNFLNSCSTPLPLLLSQFLGNQHWVSILLLFKRSTRGAGGDDGNGQDDYLTFLEHILINTRFCAKCFIWAMVFQPLYEAGTGWGKGTWLNSHHM